MEEIPIRTSKRVLLSAYGCLPHRGSEPGIGWNTAVALSEHADVWVLTKAGNRERIEKELAQRPREHLFFEYLDVPPAAERLGDQVQYLSWQARALGVARRLHEKIEFDVAHHVSFVRYWTPSLVSELPIPFVWGPVGGAESTRMNLEFGTYGTAFEVFRSSTLALSSLNPWVHRTARNSAVTLAASEETARRVQALGARDVRLMSPVGAPPDTLDRGRSREADGSQGRRDGPAVFSSVTGSGRLMHWKGVHLGLRAFAHADLADSEFHVFGSGREQSRLEALAEELGVSRRVRFRGDTSREEMLQVLEGSHALVHPAIHDPGATVIPEAMALGVPVICLDAGGPAILVDDDTTGFKAPLGSVEQIATSMGRSMRRLAQEPGLRTAMRVACRTSARERFSWPMRAKRFMKIYEELVG